jgi:leucine dehydrogenase
MLKTYPINNTNEYTLKKHINNEISFFIICSNKNQNFPFNGGLRLLNYQTTEEAIDDGIELARAMSLKHDIYNTGFSGSKIVARGEVTSKTKFLLINAVAKCLNELKGEVYTGCDLNTNLADMKDLNNLSPYVLAANNTLVDPSYATASGIYGCIRSIMREDINKKSFLINGVGKVGAAIFEILKKNGAEIYLRDIIRENEKKEGGNSLENRDWVTFPVDCLVLSSSSKIITPEIAKKLQCKNIVSATNNPFSNKEVEKILTERSINWLPDTISNAGAVICDSIEFYEKEIFSTITPPIIYNFIENISYQKTNLFNWIYSTNLNKSTSLEMLRNLGKSSKIKCGNLFKFFIKTPVNPIFSNYHLGCMEN